jgi:redox-sensitive bicupin YhaK (pirin superfamily)
VVLEGEVPQPDTLGPEQVIRPGQLDLGAASRGVAHSEEATGPYTGQLQRMQLWVAQRD